MTLNHLHADNLFFHFFPKILTLFFLSKALDMDDPIKCDFSVSNLSYGP